MAHFRAIINRAEKRVRQLLDKEETKLWHRREKLQHLLLKEHEEFVQEQAERDAIRECGYCENKNRKEQYEEDLDKEKIRECLKALEREKMLIIIYNFMLI